ncbi:Receptor-like protein 47 [Citrus sinensis]|uniref:Receptor-like protein 47 n=1 Tax=Citrus sinensis TaxID=2711 RepID=A0ACB8KDL5_CITSI|nr:Receptor-like protein 47 [Citrus sinensis]
MPPLCHDDERSALLQFKESRISNDFYASKFDCRPTMASWKPEEGNVDCCSWDGVHCNKNTGHVIKLDLSHSCLFGSINSSSSLSKFGKLPVSVGKLHSLEELDLSANILSSEWPISIGNLSSLKELDLSQNRFFGELPISMGNLGSLKELDLSQNGYFGQITSSLRNLSQLFFLDLAQNSYRGTIELDVLLTSWKNLEFLALSLNRLSVLTKATSNTTSQKLKYIGLRSCNLTKFPNFLQNQHHLLVLDLSNNRIQEKVPKWLLDPNMQNLNALNISHNLLTRFDQYPVVLPGNKGDLLTFDLSSNNLQGPFPVPPPGTIHYLASNNNLTGEIPSWICNLNILESLVLSHNNLSGLLPQCLGNFSDELSVLDLQGNNFFGTVPNTFIKESRLGVIDLSHNLFQGRIPRSLINCSKLEFLGLGNNQISDTFPSWLGTLPNLNVLILRSNIFYGIIKEPRTDCGFSKLRIIDLSNNRFTGTLPSKSFLCWNAMKIVNTRLIPQGKQFATFDNTSFDGNSGLCGRPLSKGCESNKAPANEDHTEGSEESLFSGASDWKIILIGYAGGLVAGLVLGFNFSTGIIGWILEKLGTQQKATRRRRRRRN